MKLYQVDSFTKEAFRGNPAGVCIVDKFPDDNYMQSIAMEMNLSETAFIEIGRDSFPIRYFTPKQEVPLCGHATLASAHILYELGLVGNNHEFTFQAQESNLAISKESGWIKMNFPTYQLSEMTSSSSRFDEIIGISSIERFKSPNNWIVSRVNTEKEVLDACPDFSAIEKEDIAVLIAVTSLSDSLAYDFVVRVFSNPKYGISEDPVTGAANCILAPYWSQRLNKATFNSKQLSQRTGEMRITLIDNRIEIMGQATTVFEIETKIVCN